MTTTHLENEAERFEHERQILLTEIISLKKELSEQQDQFKLATAKLLEAYEIIGRYRDSEG